ncbi:hypothetical protein AMJ57_00245 [Parcubacteria bacterium SG8_24]|nr:MAG: hypothetical protein AMJ57_00245 [Parcubacteria bacterium SG8_24]
MSVKKAELFVSVVAPLQDEAGAIKGFVDEASAVLDSSYANYELLLVDDGSRDRTRDEIGGLLATYKCLRYLRLARRAGREAAVMTGLESVIGDYAVIMSASLDPVDRIPAMVAEAARGNGVVLGVRGPDSRESLASRWGGRAFRWYCRRFLGFTLPTRLSGMAVLSRQAINSLVRVKGKGSYLRLFTKYTGLDHREIEHVQAPRPGASGKATSPDGFWRKLETATDIAVSNSTHPLRAVTYLGLIAGAINLLSMTYIVAVYLLKDDVQPGWTTSSMQSAVMFFLVFVILTVFAEYLGKLMNQVVPHDTDTVIEDLTSSTLLADEQKLNVIDRSERADDERTYG